MLPVNPRLADEQIEKFPNIEVTIIKEVDLKPDVSGEKKMQFKNPSYTDQIDIFATEEDSTVNLIDAVEKGYVKIVGYDSETGNLSYEMIPLPRSFFEDRLLHMASVDNEGRVNNFVNGFQSLLKSRKGGFTFLQTTGSEVEGSYRGFDYLQHGEQEDYIRLYFNTDALFDLRDIYLDQECIVVTPEEYPKAFVVKGGIPRSTLERAEIIRVEVKTKPTYGSFNGITLEEHQKQIDFRKTFLLDYLAKYINKLEVQEESQRDQSYGSRTQNQNNNSQE